MVFESRATTMALLVSIALVALVLLSNTDSEATVVYEESEPSDKFHALLGGFEDEDDSGVDYAGSDVVQNKQATTHLIDLSKSALNSQESKEDPVEHVISTQMDDALGDIASSKARSKEIMHKAMYHEIDESEDGGDSLDDDVDMQIFRAKAKKEEREKQRRRQEMEQLEDKEMKVLEARHQKLAKTSHEPHELSQKAAEKKRLQQMVEDPFSSNFSDEIAAKKEAEALERQKDEKEKRDKARQKLAELAEAKKREEVKKAAAKIQDEKDQKSMSAERAMKAKIFADDTAGSGGLVETTHVESKAEKPKLHGAFKRARALAVAEHDVPKLDQRKLRQRLSIIKAVVRGKEEANKDMDHLEKKYGTKDHPVMKHIEVVETAPNHSGILSPPATIEVAQPKPQTTPPKVEIQKARIVQQAKITAKKAEKAKQEAKKAAEAKKTEEKAKKTEVEARKVEETAKAEEAAAKAEEQKEAKKHADLVHEYQKTLDKLHHKIRVKVHAKVEKQHLVEAKKTLLHKLVEGHREQKPVKEAIKPVVEKRLTKMERKIAALQIQLRAERLARIRAEDKAQDLKKKVEAREESTQYEEKMMDNGSSKGFGHTEILAQMRSIAESDDDDDLFGDHF